MPPSAIGQFRIVRQLGEGGMGVVYEAVNDAIERRVAIKVLHPEYAKDRETASRFFDEARAVNRIEHPSLVQVSDYGRAEDGTAYLVMEFLRGESLAQRLDRTHTAGSRLEPSEVVRIAWQVSDALRAAHEKGIIHRDLKPDNLMLVRDPIAPGGERVKILDFGIAKLMRSGVKRTATSAVMGTPLYMSPEQCRGAGEVDDRSDVYSLGVVLYEMLAGRCPFEAAGGGEVLGMHLFKEPPALAALAPTAPADLVALTHRLLHKDREARPHMATVAGELSRIGAKLSSSVEFAAAADTDQTRLIATDNRVPSAPPGRSSTLGRSVGENYAKERSFRMVSIAGGVLIFVGSLLWLVFREPTPSSAPLSKPLAAAGASDDKAVPQPVTFGSDGGTNVPDAGTGTARRVEGAASTSTAQKPGVGPRRDVRAVPPPSSPAVRPKPSPAVRKSALSDVD